jgi:hypothetical protein
VGLAVSLILIVFGAILAFAVHSHSSGVDVNTVGWILMGAGLLGLLLTLLFWESWFGRGMYSPRAGYYAEPGPRPWYGYSYGYGRRQRQVVVEEAPAAGPYDAPPQGPPAPPPPPP